ncbi:MAG: zinc-dependent peptidase [Sedimentisphaerales bacterium]|nr:zinc-dependent peptidase [Sedimentisphaerales bacterium]
MPYVELALAGALLTAVVLVARPLLRQARRQRLMAVPFPEAWRRIVEKNVPLYGRLPQALQQELHGLIHIFLDEKRFEGCGGLEIDDTIRVTIAAQACMLLLNRKTTCFRKLRTILVYPDTYVAKTLSSDGRIAIDDHSVRLGESWQNGPVVLAWNSVTGGASNIADARNVVFHEFAHQLDQEDGVADGAPVLERRSAYTAWARVLGEEYAALQKSREARRRSVMSKYGATHPAEFFAVATETFFEKPRQMQKRHPELYEELRDYYRLDPLQWTARTRD